MVAGRCVASLSSSKTTGDDCIMERCEICSRIERFRYEHDLKPLEKRSFTVKERRSFAMKARNILNTVPQSRAELMRSLLMLYVLEVW